MLKRYKEAAQTLQVYPSRAPNVRILPLWLAAANAQLGQLAEAKAEAAEVLRIEPGFTIERWKCTVPYKNPQDAEHLFDGLRKAGLPEGVRQSLTASTSTCLLWVKGGGAAGIV